MQTKLISTILALQPLFPVFVYFSVLTGHPPLWLSLTIAVIPLGISYWYSRQIIRRTLFDMPILFFVGGTLVGFIVSPDKQVGLGYFASTVASILVYFGITNNSGASKRYWFWTGGIMCLITMVLSLWFFSQSVHRVLSFNQWAFNLFAGLPKTVGPVLNLHTIGALLAVMIPPLFVMVFLKNRISLRIIILTLFLLFSMMLFLSDSGTGWLAIIVGMTFILVCWQKKLLWILIPTEGVITGAAVLFYDKIEWLRTTFSTSSFMSRIELWRNTITLLKGKAAITGLGSGSWLSVYNTHYSNSVAHVHNSYLQLYCDAGVLGFIAMILAAVIFIRFSINLLKLHQQHPLYWIGIGLIGTVISGAVFAIFDVTYSVTDVTKTGYIDLGLPLLWIGAALISVINNKLLER